MKFVKFYEINRKSKLEMYISVNFQLKNHYILSIFLILFGPCLLASLIEDTILTLVKNPFPDF